MRIGFGEEGRPYIDVIGSMEEIIKKISGRWQNNKEKKFLQTRHFLVEFRHLFSSIALEYYKEKKISFNYGFPLLIKDNWIPQPAIELSKIQISWKTEKDTINPPTLNSFPVKGSYVENIKDFYPEIKLENRFAYKLNDIHWSNCLLDLNFSPSQYFDYVNTCEVLSYEFCWSLLKKHKEILPLKNLKFYNMRFPLRENINIFNFTNRSTVAGINTLLIILNKNKQGKHYYYFHKRLLTELAEAMGTYHVVPAGTFQPDSFNDNFHERDFNLFRNILRELAEELLGKDDLSSMIKNEKDFVEEYPISEYLSLFKNSNAKVFFLGVGLDPLTTKPEILTCMVVDASKINKKINLNFRDNYEGEHFMVPFTKKDIKRYIQHENILPAGAACLAVVEKQYELFANLF